MATADIKQSQSGDPADKTLPPLENGDRLTVEEFRRRYEAMPEKTKAELINGVVYMHERVPDTPDRANPKNLPPLENGDRLTVAEFRERYDAMPQLKKAELINGVVYVQEAVRRDHSDSHAALLMWLSHYWAMTPGTAVNDNGSVRELKKGSEPQPDAHLRIERGGQTKWDGDYLSGAPEFVAEVSGSSASYDLHDKFEMYLNAGVREYLVWRVYDEQIDWFVLTTDGKYEPLTANEDGIKRSLVFPGLWLDETAMVSGKPQTVLSVLQQGLTTPEHTAFVDDLRNRK